MNTLRTTILLTMFGLALAGCEQQGPFEEAGERVDEAAEDVGNAVEDACEDVKDAAGARDEDC